MAVARRTIGARSAGGMFTGRVARAWRRVHGALTAPATHFQPGRHADPHELRTLDDWIMRGGPRIH
jgi:hypothetical protein